MWMKGIKEICVRMELIDLYGWLVIERIGKQLQCCTEILLNGFIMKKRKNDKKLIVVYKFHQTVLSINHFSWTCKYTK